MGQRQAGGGKETGLRALGERPSSGTLGRQLPSTSPTCSCDGKERTWDVMRVFCSLPITSELAAQTPQVGSMSTLGGQWWWC